MTANAHERLDLASARLVSVGRVARELDVSTSTVRRWIRHGDLQAVRLASGAVRVRREHVDAFIITETEGPP